MVQISGSVSFPHHLFTPMLRKPVTLDTSLESTSFQLGSSLPERNAFVEEQLESLQASGAEILETGPGFVRFSMTLRQWLTESEKRIREEPEIYTGMDTYQTPDEIELERFAYMLEVNKFGDNRACREAVVKCQEQLAVEMYNARRKAQEAAPIETEMARKLRQHFPVA